MFCGYQDRVELEDALYGEEEDSQGSEVDSELEFRLYSQLHYASNNREKEEDEENIGGEEGKMSEELPQPEEEEDMNSQKEEKRTIPPKKLKSQESGLPMPCQQGQKAQRQKKANKETPGKPKKKTKGDRNTTSLNEEVIVIDSGTDVITVSDSEESTCALKGQRSKKQTPVEAVPLPPKGTKKRKRSLSPEVVVLDSQEDSEEEEEEEELETSDSDGLESWMILGKGNQDGDTSISLNVEGVDHGNSADGAEAGNRVWTVSSKDREAQIYNRNRGQTRARFLPSRYYTEKNVTCGNCNKTGHLSKNCPTPTKGPSCLQCGVSSHSKAGCPETLCSNCGLPGHLYRDCREKAHWYRKCHRCGMAGHVQDACPEIWRQYHITVTLGPPKVPKTELKGRDPPYCSNCSKKGHFGFDCSQRMMFSGTYRCTPFINFYDTKEELRRRDARLQLRVKEMKEVGTFPSQSQSQSPLTPKAPPRKKQKTNANNNHTPNHSNFNHKQKINNQVQLCESRRGYTSMPTTKMATRELPKKSGEKPWKPKWKPPPKKNDGTAGVVTVMEEDTDFIRGGGRVELECNAEATTKKKKKTKKNKKKEQNAEPGSAGAPFQPTRHVPDRLFSAAAPGHKKKKVRARGRERKAAQSAAADMYPTDENLFTIKQRKRNR